MSRLGCCAGVYRTVVTNGFGIEQTVRYLEYKLQLYICYMIRGKLDDRKCRRRVRMKKMEEAPGGMIEIEH